LDGKRRVPLALRLAFAILPATFMTKGVMVRTVSRRAVVSNKADMISPNNVTLGEKVYIDDYVLLDALRGSISVGPRTEVLRSSVLSSMGGRIQMGSDCSVNPFCVLYGHGGLTVGNEARIAAHTVIAPYNHSVPSLGIQETRRGVRIGNEVWIGASSIILDGVSIGDGAVVGAGSVVNHDVAPGTLVVGVPAREIRASRGFESKRESTDSIERQSDVR
jgi:acetyltransferase-like isoleucine patch superfamily enzyme